MSQVKFCGLEIGWFDEQGVTPAGTAATQVDIYAAQVKDGYTCRTSRHRAACR